MGERVRVIFDHGGALVIATCGPVLVTVARGAVTKHYLEEALEAGRALGRQYPRAVGSLTLTTVEVPLPEPAIRELATRVSRESDAWVRAATTVVDGEGFKASVIRSLLVTMTIFQGGAPRRVFSAHAPAIDWLTRTLPLEGAASGAIREWADEALARSIPTAS